MISAPGAVGKSALAKHIPHSKNALHWDLSKNVLGDNVFLGTISKAFGTKQISLITDVIGQGRLPIIIDALDEAEVRSGSTQLEKTLVEIVEFVSQASTHCIVLMARTDTARYVHSILSESSSL